MVSVFFADTVNANARQTSTITSIVLASPCGDRETTQASSAYSIVCVVIPYFVQQCIDQLVANLLVVSGTGKMNISLSPLAPENLVSQDGFGRPVPRQLDYSPHAS